MLSNSQQLIELVLNQKQEFEEYYKQENGNSKKINQLRDNHFNQIQTLLKSKFFHGVFKYKDDEYFSKPYLINQFKDFVLNINEFGIFNKSQYLQQVEYPKVIFRFKCVYCPKIIIENCDFESFKTNLCMYSFIDGYNKMFNNYQQRLKNIK
tara:strand:- start:18 stop:473 length:456 start_codon:yes stop_codon:yes gene_type:complete